LHWAINFSDSGSNASFELEAILIEHGAEINTSDNFGRTPLHYPFIKTNDFKINTEIDPIEAVNSLLLRKDLVIDQ
jgi:ankyrin repeat protein